MTKVIAQNSELWTMRKIQSLVGLETKILKKQLMNIQSKVTDFESRYKKLDRDSLYGQVDDMELLEWEGEIETIDRLRKKLTFLEQIAFEMDRQQTKATTTTLIHQRGAINCILFSCVWGPDCFSSASLRKIVVLEWVGDVMYQIVNCL